MNRLLPEGGGAFVLAVVLLGAVPIGAVPVFTDVTAQAGLDVPHGELPPDLPLNGSTPDFYVSSVAVVDVDGDGWPDIHLTRFEQPGALYRNNGDGTFTDILPGSGLEVARRANSAAWADFDNDGHPEVFMSSLLEDRHYYFVNNGDGTFREVGLERGLALPVEGLHHGMSVAIGDVNRDGWLDLFITQWGVDLEGADPTEHTALMVNRGREAPGYFRNATREAGLVIEGTRLPGEQHGFSAFLSDFDGDGWLDLGYVADFGNSEFFWGRGNGRFSEATEAARVGTEQNGMGGAVGDIDNDGDLDWFVTSIDGTFSDGLDGNRLYRYDGGRRFTDVTDEAGVRNGGWAWGAAFFDADNDGDLDLVQTNGFMPGEPGAPDDPFTERTLLWINDGTGRFTEVGASAGIGDVARGQGIAVLDYDRDGDLDFIVTNSYYKPVLYRNDTEVSHNWLRVHLTGTVSNRDAVGARVEVETEPEGGLQMRELTPGNGYLAQSEGTVHFGFGDFEGPLHRLTVYWPAGGTLELAGVELNREITLTEVDEGLQRAPAIVRAPVGGEARRDERVVLAVEVLGNPEPAYQWLRDGVVLEGETGPELVIEAMRPFDAADYSVQAANALGQVETEPVRLEYRPPVNRFSVARQWNELNLDAIRVDYPDPTVHSRNLFHCSVAMWDAYVAYDPGGQLVPYLAEERGTGEDREAARKEAISYGAYRVLSSRYQLSPSRAYSQADFDAKMEELGYDPDNRTMRGQSPAAIGNRIAAKVLAYGWRDGANEAHGYADLTGYEPVNEPLIFKLPGVEVEDPNRWQPLSFDFLVLQNGLPVGAATQDFLGLNWRQVEPFALEIPADGRPPLDPGPPPQLGGTGDAAFKDGALTVIRYSSLLDPESAGTIDVSPGAYYNNTLGTNDGSGYAENPITGEPYGPNRVNLADYARIIAEFWADGPDSETPPGHWNTLANHVTETLPEKRLYGDGPLLDGLAWDVHLYFALNGALHDAAIAAWAAKRYYDYVRPVTLIRHMGALGQSSDPEGPSYHTDGLPLEPGLVELVTEASAAPGGHHAHLREHIGKIALYCWRGEPEDPETEVGGVGWIAASKWMPYQRFSFVTPPFAAYVSGHSAFSRAAAEVLSAFTGSPYFPGGEHHYEFVEGDFLHFETGPTETVRLTWARYYDAADEAGLSRIYGGIHVPADDFEGRIVGSAAGLGAWEKARGYFEGTAAPLSWRIENAEHHSLFEDPRAGRMRWGMDATGRPLVRMRLPAGLTENRMRVSLSTDLESWETVPFSEVLQSLEFTDHGNAEAILSPDNGEARFMRLVLLPAERAGTAPDGEN